MLSTGHRLRAIKTFHTLIWVLLAGCVSAIPILALNGNFAPAAILIGVVWIEVLVLYFNEGRCPLTDVAARYTLNRRDNFDIYLPEWLARHNKLIFGTIYVAGLMLTIWLWMASQ